MGYFRVNVTRLSYAEVWRWGNRTAFFAFALRKLLRWSMYGEVLVPDAPAIVVLQPEQVRSDFLAALQGALADALSAGFAPLFHYHAATQGPAEGVALASLHSSGRSVCVATVAQSGSLREVGVTVVSKVQGDTFIATGDGGTILQPAPEVEASFMPGQRTSAIVARHLERIASRSVIALARSDVEPLILSLQRVSLAHNIRRGVYVPADQ